MRLFKSAFSGAILGLCSLISACNLNPEMKRIDMFKDRDGLPTDFDREDFNDTYEKRFYKERKLVYISICFHGRYNFKGTDGLYVDPEEAERLLLLYGWKEK